MNTPIIKKGRVRMVPGASTGHAGHAPRAGARDGQKAVRLLEHEGVVHAIELTCSCGSTTVIEIDYPETAPQPEREGDPT